MCGVLEHKEDTGSRAHAGPWGPHTVPGVLRVASMWPAQVSQASVTKGRGCLVSKDWVFEGGVEGSCVVQKRVVSLNFVQVELWNKWFRELSCRVHSCKFNSLPLERPRRI